MMPGPDEEDCIARQRVFVSVAKNKLESDIWNCAGVEESVPVNWNATVGNVGLSTPVTS